MSEEGRQRKKGRRWKMRVEGSETRIMAKGREIKVKGEREINGV